MAENYVSKTGLRYFWNRIKTVFASKTELSDLSDRVDELANEGGEPNVIETVKVNGTALTPDASKAVDINAASIQHVLSSKIVSVLQGTTGVFFVTTHQGIEELTKAYGDGTQEKVSLATIAYVDANGGKIDKIMVNGVEQTISTKTVELTVPTKTSDLSNDSDFLTEAEVDQKIATAVTSVYRVKEPVSTVDDLPMTGNEIGDVRDVQATGMNYEWTGSGWEPLGYILDTSELWEKTELTAITTAEIDTIIDGTGS